MTEGTVLFVTFSRQKPSDILLDTLSDNDKERWIGGGTAGEETYAAESPV